MAKKSSSSGRRGVTGPVPGRIFEMAAVGIHTPKGFGEAAEAAFLAKASRFGFAVAKPWGDSERYDFIVDSGEHFWAVQVKSTQQLTSGSRYRVRVGGCKRAYTAEDIDFLVAYVIPENAWYVVPIGAAAGRVSLSFFPQSKSKNGLEKYREAWCQMACQRGARDPKLITVERGCQKGGRKARCAMR